MKHFSVCSWICQTAAPRQSDFVKALTNTLMNFLFAFVNIL